MMVLFSRLSVPNWLFAILAVIVSLLHPTPCLAQGVATGTPSFGSQAGGPDVINLANLNVHWNIPVRHVTGRGLDFIFDLNYDSSVWIPVTLNGTATWQPSAVWGWSSSLLTVGNITNSETISHGTCYDQHHIQHSTTTYTWRGWTYVDAFGTQHPFAGTSGHTDGCTVSSYGFTAAAALDGSGYTLTTYGASATSLYARDGSLINAPVNNIGGTGGSTDRNGNQISYNSSTGVFTDTLGNSALTRAGAAPSPVTYSYPTPSGLNAAFQVKFSSYSIRTNFGCSTVGDYGTNGTMTANLVSEIDLPDGSKYSFGYEPTPGFSGFVTGRIAIVSVPTGGKISYTYPGPNNGIVCADGSTSGLQRSTPDSGSGYWSYMRTPETGVAYLTTVTDATAQANQTVVQFQGIYETQRDIYAGSAPAITTFPIPESTLQTTNLLKETQTCYNGNTSNCTSTAVALPFTRTTVFTAWPGPGNGKTVSRRDTLYNALGQGTEVDEYDYGAAGSGVPGGIIRKTLTTWSAIGNGSFAQTKTVQDGASNVKAQTTYYYDQTAVTTTTGTPQHVLIVGSRGNVTTVSTLVSGSTTLNKTYTYYDTGSLKTVTDVNGAVATYNYASGSCGNSFATSISEPLSMSRSTTWNCTGGVLTSATDENGNTSYTNYTADKYFWRPNSTQDQLTNTTTYTYTAASGSTLASTEISTVFNSGGSTTDTLTTQDSLGRAHVSQIKQGPSLSTYDSTETDYDALGRPSRRTLPYSGPAGQTSSSAPATTTTYDALSRQYLVTDGGNGTVQYSYSQNDASETKGPPPSGEITKKKQMEYDAMGRLSSVCEVTGAIGSGPCGQVSSQTGYWTKYAYDVNNKLLGVSQNAQGSTTQTRSYTYDAHGRMLTESNPETYNSSTMSHTTSYTYDTDATCGTSNGDLVKKLDPMGNVTCYSYDILHRLMSVTHPSGTYASVTPNRYFVYDAATVNGVAMSNGKMHQVEAYTCSSCPSTKLTDVGFSYTKRGELSDVYESTPNSGGFYHSNATYWANGAVNMLTAYNNANALVYGAGWNLDGEGRVNSNYNTGSNPLSGTTYNAASQPTQVTFSSGDSDSYSYDSQTNRMTQYKFNLPNQSVTGNLTWNANATLQSLTIQDTFNTANTQTCNYAHDDLVRIASINCPGNQLANPGFEQGLSSWTPYNSCSAQLETNSANAHSGSNYVQVSAASGGICAILGPYISVKPGDQVTFGGWADLQSGSPLNWNVGWTLSVFDSNHNGITSFSSTPNGSSGWTYESGSAIMPSGAAYAYVYAQVYTPSASTVLWVDDAFIEDTSIWSQTFAYDAFGNITKNGSMSFQPMYSATTNQMTSIGGLTPTYDSNGNVLGDFLHTYSWDADGHPLKADGVNLTYDALGRMVEQQRSGVYTQFLYSPTGFKMMLFSGQSNLVARVPLPAGSRADYDPSGLHIRHGDWLGSSRFTSTLSSRTMYSDGAYGPFGEPYAQAGTSDLSFTGMDQDTATNLYDFPAREYGIQGRWPSPDPAGLAAAHPQSPQSWNRYAYVQNSPLTLMDPNGTDCFGSDPLWGCPCDPFEGCGGPCDPFLGCPCDPIFGCGPCDPIFGCGPISPGGGGGGGRPPIQPRRLNIEQPAGTQNWPGPDSGICGISDSPGLSIEGGSIGTTDSSSGCGGSLEFGGVKDCGKALRELERATEQVAARTKDIVEGIARDGHSDPGHIKALKQAMNRLENALEDVTDHCGDFIGAAAAVALAVIALEAAEAAIAAAAAALASVPSPGGSHELPNGAWAEFDTSFAWIHPMQQSGARA
jgi:RHS repeat-associated protein